MEDMLAELIWVFPSGVLFGLAVYCFYRFFVFGEIVSLVLGIIFLILVLIDIFWYIFKKESFLRLI